LKQNHRKAHHGHDQQRRIPGHRKEIIDGDVVSLRERIGRPEKLQIWNGDIQGRQAAVDRGGTGSKRPAQKELAHKSGEKHRDTDQQRQHLSHPRRCRHGHRSEHENRLEDEHDGQHQLRPVVGERMLQEPVAGDESHDADRRRHAQGQADSQRRWKRPSIEIVHRAGDDQPADTAEETEGQHRPIPRLTMSHSNVDLVPYDQQEHRHEDVVGKRNCETDAKKLADDQSGPRDWLADDRQHRLVLDFPGKDTRGSECRQHDAREEQRAEPEIDEQLVVLS